MKLKESNGSIGLYTERPYKKGEVLFELRGPVKANATSTSIQISKAKHIEDAYAQYINHHCNPSVKVIGRKIVAHHDIKSNDEITFNKNEMTDELQKPFVCKCCGKLLQGKNFISV